MSNFDINVDRGTGGQMEGRTEKQMSMSQSQIKEMFHAWFSGYLVL